MVRGLYRADGSFKREKITPSTRRTEKISMGDLEKIFTAVLKPYGYPKEHTDVITRLINSIVDLYTRLSMAEEIISRKVVRIDRFSCPAG